MANEEFNTKIVTGLVRLAYCNVWEPKEDLRGEKKFSTVLLIDKKDKATLINIKRAMDAVKADPKSMTKWGTAKGLFIPLRDGDEEDGYCEMEEFQGRYFLNCKNTRKPKLLTKSKQEVVDDDLFYSGCYAQAIVNLFAYNNQSKGIGVSLLGLRFIKDGEKLAGMTASADDFQDGMIDKADLVDDDDIY